MTMVLYTLISIRHFMKSPLQSETGCFMKSSSLFQISELRETPPKFNTLAVYIPPNNILFHLMFCLKLTSTQSLESSTVLASQDRSVAFSLLGHALTGGNASNLDHRKCLLTLSWQLTEQLTLCKMIALTGQVSVILVKLKNHLARSSSWHKVQNVHFLTFLFVRNNKHAIIHVRLNPYVLEILPKYELHIR